MKTKQTQQASLVPAACRCLAAPPQAPMGGCHFLSAVPLLSVVLWSDGAKYLLFSFFFSLFFVRTCVHDGGWRRRPGGGGDTGSWRPGHDGAPGTRPTLPRGTHARPRGDTGKSRCFLYLFAVMRLSRHIYGPKYCRP